MRFDRRRLLRAAGHASLLSAVGAAGAACSSFSPLSPFLRQTFKRGPVEVPPLGTRAFVRRCFDGLDKTRVWDMHAHVFGDGRGDTGLWVHPRYREDFLPSLLFDVYLASGGVEDTPDAQDRAVERVVRMQRLANPQGKVLVVGFDWFVDEKGEERRDLSAFYTPDAYVKGLAERYPDVFRWACSVHPYRKDALDRLDQAAAEGALAMKWLPNAQGIDLTHPACVPLYKRLAELRLPLLLHTGLESAAEATNLEELGNPLLLRAPLDHGVIVIAAHCAGLGDNPDIDAPAGERRRMENYDLLRRLLDDKQYESTLWADISAMTQWNRVGRPLREVILDKALHPRLLHGSDFPLPAIRWLVSSWYLEREGYLSHHDRVLCDRVDEVNPLLYDFVIKRCLRVEEGGQEHRLSDIVFESRRAFAHLPHA